jgi:hypothetical protein
MWKVAERALTHDAEESPRRGRLLAHERARRCVVVKTTLSAECGNSVRCANFARAAPPTPASGGAASRTGLSWVCVGGSPDKPGDSRARRSAHAACTPSTSCQLVKHPASYGRSSVGGGTPSRLLSIPCPREEPGCAPVRMATRWRVMLAARDYRGRTTAHQTRRAATRHRLRVSGRGCRCFARRSRDAPLPGAAPACHKWTVATTGFDASGPSTPVDLVSWIVERRRVVLRMVLGECAEERRFGITTNLGYKVANSGTGLFLFCTSDMQLEQSREDQVEFAGSDSYRRIRIGHP